jgi:RNA-directed DNA polymerase
MRQKTELEITLRAGARGEARSAGAEGTEARAATTEVESRAARWPSMEAIVERDNLRKALAQVKRNKGAAGVDGMSLGALAPYLAVGGQLPSTLSSRPPSSAMLIRKPGSLTC